jgi:hypothetical protein
MGVDSTAYIEGDSEDRVRIAPLWIVGMIVFLPIASVSDVDEPNVRWLGEFSNLESDGEHESGFSIALWNDREALIGILFAHSGLIGDPPRGFLEDVNYDRASGAITFEVRFLSGSMRNSKNEWVRSKTHIKFKGSLSTEMLEGDLEEFWIRDGEPRLFKAHTLKLLPTTHSLTMPKDYGSHDTWREYYAKFLDRYKW